MGLFGGKFKKKPYVLGAPVSGRCVNVTEVNDATFSAEMLGKGVAVLPAGNCIMAPAAGEITTAFDTGHALTMKTENGAELLIHIGIDTVELKGRHFQMKVVQGQKVSRGDLLAEADMEAIQAEGYDTVTMMVVCNTESFSKIKCLAPADVKEGDGVIELTV